jgi:hypothetical protein
MQDNANSELPAPKRIPWNKGKLTGAKPPLRQKHVWAIRTKLQIDQRPRDLAMFNLAIDSKLRPDGNVTGVGSFMLVTGSKRLGLLRELVRPVTVAVLTNPDNPSSHIEMEDLQSAAARDR